MLTKRDIRVIMLYEFKCGTNATKTAQNINEIFGEELGNEDLENEDRGKPPTIINNDELQAAVEANPNQSVRELAEIFNVSKSTISRHLREIGKPKNAGK
uniref:Mos1 transposase HTH domain-containing protein n=1 Tax=Strongyloides stercoralis TaxID=6248 RepID=A0AAF5DF89_STRER